MGTDLPLSTAPLGAIARRKRKFIVIRSCPPSSQMRAGDLRAGRQSTRLVGDSSTGPNDDVGKATDDVAGIWNPRPGSRVVHAAAVWNQRSVRMLACDSRRTTHAAVDLMPAQHPDSDTPEYSRDAPRRMAGLPVAAEGLPGVSHELTLAGGADDARSSWVCGETEARAVWAPRRYVDHRRARRCRWRGATPGNEERDDRELGRVGRRGIHGGVSRRTITRRTVDCGESIS
jgi:hypothetical protein